MDRNVRRVFVEKKKQFAAEAANLFLEIKEGLNMQCLQEVRIANRYDVEGLLEHEFAQALDIVFSEPTVDHVYLETLTLHENEIAFAVEYLPGQYDQRADSAAQCIQILTQKDRPLVKAAKVIVLKGSLSADDITRIKSYCINSLDSREAAQEKPEKLELETIEARDVLYMAHFIDLNRDELKKLQQDMGLAMTYEDFEFCQQYFKSEKRNPSITEIKVIDTYWSDHCRHTTFLTELEAIDIGNSLYCAPIKEALTSYQHARKTLYPEKQKEITLMDMATIAMKKLRSEGKLVELEVSDEINACSIVVDIEVNGAAEEWLLMFKNETHNHPTEIEPFGGAATCLGGAIRDPLSGRSYVFGAMRVTGSADPREAIEAALAGKLPQRKITTGAAAGFSSYGNQIGLATGQVAEIYHPDYVAKRMEIGAVLGAAPRSSVIRAVPQTGDVIVLLGGRTGRDGCGGATGSSKEHDDSSLLSCGAEVQKGNPPTERKIQRLFRNPEVSRLIKKCNDFGAGGVAVAIGELAEGLTIDLDCIPKKYEGLDGTELAISESQERMAVVLDAKDLEFFIQFASEENLEAIKVAAVTEQKRLLMQWRGKAIVDISREFLNTNGVKQKTNAVVASPVLTSYFEETKAQVEAVDMEKEWLNNLQDLNVCSQRGLGERFDSSIGSGTVLVPYGGKHQLTPVDGLVMKLPVKAADTNAGVIMTYGFNPYLSSWSPFHGAVYAIVEAVAKVAVLGGDYSKVKLTLQEYFEKLGKDPVKWGKPVSALLGAFYAQDKLQLAAIGGKDSMSGTFKELNVAPTLVAFAVDTLDVSHVVSPEFKKSDSSVILLPLNRDAAEMPDFDQLKINLQLINKLAKQKKLLSASVVKQGGIAAAISKMCFGNRIGVKLDPVISDKEWFTPDYGSVLLELDQEADLEALFDGVPYIRLGCTSTQAEITLGTMILGLNKAQKAWQEPLEKVFPSSLDKEKAESAAHRLYNASILQASTTKNPKPRVLIPVFPGTNCEYDTEAAFLKAGGDVRTLVIRNLSSKDIEESIQQLSREIRAAQIVALPGGFSAGDEPDGSGKFIAAMFRNPRIREDIMELLKQRDGLMLGICNGFQALIKLGLVPFGEIIDLNTDCPTLTYNSSGRHISCMASTQIVSNLSPWLALSRVGEVHTIPISHGEGRFAADQGVYEKLRSSGQIATQYIDFNPNGSMYHVEGITSPDGRVFGKMGHSERIGSNVAINVPGHKDQRIFEAGIQYFR